MMDAPEWPEYIKYIVSQKQTTRPPTVGDNFVKI